MGWEYISEAEHLPGIQTALHLSLSLANIIFFFLKEQIYGLWLQIGVLDTMGREMSVSPVISFSFLQLRGHDK